MKGLVSVIVSTYNKPDYLALTLRSLRAQTDRDFEVIVADDGSDERTKCVVKCEEKFSDLTTKHVWFGIRNRDSGWRPFVTELLRRHPVNI